MKKESKLTVTVPSDTNIDVYLWTNPIFLKVDHSSEMACYEYGGLIPPLAKISQLLAMFEPTEYTISRSTKGFFFIVWSNE